MLAGGFLDRSSLSRDGLLFRLPLLPCSRFDGAGQVGNFRPLRADFLLLGLGVGIHFSINDLAN